MGSSLVWIALTVAATVLQLCSSTGLGAHLSSLSDKITQLPGQPPVSFQQFSGYITVGEKRERALFYYFAEAEVDPLSKPLVLWLNGGNAPPLCPPPPTF